MSKDVCPNCDQQMVSTDGECEFCDYGRSCERCAKLEEILKDARQVIEFHAGNGSPSARKWLEKHEAEK